jgi:hypothetical protein
MDWIDELWVRFPDGFILTPMGPGKSELDARNMTYKTLVIPPYLKYVGDDGLWVDAHSIEKGAGVRFQALEMFDDGDGLVVLTTHEEGDENNIFLTPYTLPTQDLSAMPEPPAWGDPEAAESLLGRQIAAPAHGPKRDTLEGLHFSESPLWVVREMYVQRYWGRSGPHESTIDDFMNELERFGYPVWPTAKAPDAPDLWAGFLKEYFGDRPVWVIHAVTLDDSDLLHVVSGPSMKQGFEDLGTTDNWARMAISDLADGPAFTLGQMTSLEVIKPGQVMCGDGRGNWAIIDGRITHDDWIYFRAVKDYTASLERTTAAARSAKQTPQSSEAVPMSKETQWKYFDVDGFLIRATTSQHGGATWRDNPEKYEGGEWKNADWAYDALNHWSPDEKVTPLSAEEAKQRFREERDSRIAHEAMEHLQRDRVPFDKDHPEAVFYTKCDGDSYVAAMDPEARTHRLFACVKGELRELPRDVWLASAHRIAAPVGWYVDDCWNHYSNGTFCHLEVKTQEGQHWSLWHQDDCEHQPVTVGPTRQIVEDSNPPCDAEPDTMYALAMEVVEGRMTAEEAAPRMGVLGDWAPAEEVHSPEAKAKRFQEDELLPGDNNFTRVTSLWMQGRLTDEQYKVLKGSFGLRFPAAEWRAAQED